MMCSATPTLPHKPDALLYPAYTSQNPPLFFFSSTLLLIPYFTFSFTSRSLFQAQTSLLLTGLPLSSLCKLAYLLVALGVELGLGKELLVSSSSFPFSSLSVAPSSQAGGECKVR